MKKWPETVTSPQNRHVKELASLFTRKGRKKHNAYPAEGVRTLAEALKTGTRVNRVAVSETALNDPQIKNLATTFFDSGAYLLIVNKPLMGKISGMETAPGIVGEIELPEPVVPESWMFSGPAVIACRVQDPRNIGLLVRTTAAAGASPLFVSGGSGDPFHPTAVSASMGAIFHSDIVNNADIKLTAAAAGQAGAVVVATSCSSGISLDEWVRASEKKYLLMIGNEGHGLDTSTERLADVKVKIPMQKDVESLNVAVSAGIILYCSTLG